MEQLEPLHQIAQLQCRIFGREPRVTTTVSECWREVNEGQLSSLPGASTPVPSLKPECLTCSGDDNIGKVQHAAVEAAKPEARER